MSLKTTIMEMIKNELRIEVVDTPIVDGEKTSQSFLFVDYVDGLKNKFKVINYNEYDLYGREVIVSDMAIESVTIDGTNYKVSSYDGRKGILVLEEEIHRLMPYEDKIDLMTVGNEFVLVTSPYSYTRRVNRNTIEYYHRYQFDLFLYDESSEDKLDYIIDKLHMLFSVDFSIDNSNSYAFIQSPLTFKRIEFLNTDKVVRGSILLRTYK